MLDLYIPKSEIVILRTNHLNELRTTGKNGVENKRTFDWLSDDTLTTIIHSFITKMKLRNTSYVINCSYNGTPFYILGALKKFHGKFAFTVISTIKSERANNPFRDVDTNNRFDFETDLSTFTTVFNQLEHDEKIAKLIRDEHNKKMETLSDDEKIQLLMQGLQNRVERRIKKEQAAKSKALKIQSLHKKIVNTSLISADGSSITSKTVRAYRQGTKKQYKENGQYD